MCAAVCSLNSLFVEQILIPWRTCGMARAARDKDKGYYKCMPPKYFEKYHGIFYQL